MAQQVYVPSTVLYHAVRWGVFLKYFTIFTTCSFTPLISMSVDSRFIWWAPHPYVITEDNSSSYLNIFRIFAVLAATKLPTLQPYLNSVNWIAVFVIPANYSAVWLLPDVSIVSVMDTSPSAVVIFAYTIGSLWILLQPSRAMLTVELRNFVRQSSYSELCTF